MAATSSLLLWHRPLLSPTLLPYKLHTPTISISRLLPYNLMFLLQPSFFGLVKMGSNAPSKLQRSLSLNSEPRTLKQYDMAIASMQAMEKQSLAVTNGAQRGLAKGKSDREEGTSGAAAAVKLPA